MDNATPSPVPVEEETTVPVPPITNRELVYGDRLHDDHDFRRDSYWNEWR